MKKTITLTNHQLVESSAALNVLATQKMAITPGFSVAKNKAALMPHTRDYEEFRQGILKRHARLDGGGNPIASHTGEALFTTMEARDAAMAELAELGAIEVTVEIRTLGLAALDGVEVEPNVLGALEWMLDEEE
jgi:hypothetical protein